MSSRELKIRITAAVDGFQAGIGKAQQSVLDFDKALQQSAQRRQAIEDLGSSFGKIGLLAAGGVALATKAAMDWESAWAGVTKTVEGSTAELATLEQQLRDMATSMPATHQEIAAVAQAAGALGVATPDVADFTRTMIMLSEATDDLSADQAATSMAQLMNVMQTAPEDVDNLANALVRLGNNGASTEGQILQLAQNLAGAGATIGLAESDVLGIANALASVGIEAEAGGSAVSKILIDMATAAKTGSPALAKWQEVAEKGGLATGTFAQAMQDAPAQAFEAFTTGLGRINAEGGDVFTLLSDLGQSDVRVTRALLGMAGAGDMLAQSLADSADAYATGTDALDEYEKRSETAAAKVQVAWNGIKDNLIDIGQDALPIVKALSEGVADLTGAFSDLPQPVKDSALRFLALTAALGGTVWAGSKAVSAITGMTESLAALTGQAGTLSRTQLFARGGSLIAGTALASIQPAANEANEALGALTATASGALIGTAILPGWGTAIGGVAGAAYGLIDAFGGTESAQAQAALAGMEASRQLTESWGELGSTLDGVNAKVTENTRLSAAESLQESGLAGRAAAMGISLRELTDVALGTQGSLASLDQTVLNSAFANGQDISGYGQVRSELVALAREFGHVTADTIDANVAALDYSTVLRGIPADVQTEIIANNFDYTAEQVAELQALYNLTPEQVETFMFVRDYLSNPVAAANQALNNLDNLSAAPSTYLIDGTTAPTSNLLDILLPQLNGTTSTPTVNLNDYASGTLGNIAGTLNNLDGRSVRSTVFIDYLRGQGSPSAPAAPGPWRMEANGGLIDFFADGGMRENHVAQIAPAGSWRVWAEPETGGEAYIPLAQSKRQRSLEIWAETGKRLGATGYADGGMTGAASSQVVATVEGPLELSENSIRRLGDYMVATGGNAAARVVGGYDYQRRSREMYG